jgi:signal transduction histidine kinase/ActR/RegA family two-component response regulator
MSPEQQEPEVGLLNRLPLGIFVLDREGRFTFLNQTARRFFQALSGRPPGELLGQSLRERCPEFADSAFTREHTEALASQRAFELEAYFPNLDRWFLVLASFDPDEQCFYLQDVSAQKRIQVQLRNRVDQLSSALDARAEFLARLAHEVRNTLAVLRNNFYLARQTPEAVARAATAGEQSVGELTAFMDDLLKLSQLLLGRVSPRKEPVDLIKTTLQAAEGIVARPAARGRTIMAGLPTGPLWVNADPELLRNAVCHLLECAIGFTQPGAQVWLSAELQQGQVILRVEDDGIGIKPEMLSHIFDLFPTEENDLEQTLVRQRAGLALVRGLIELQGGTVKVSSEGPGTGSEFTVALPAAPPLPGSGGALCGPTGAGRQVLVVDNYSAAADSLAGMLKLWRHDVHVAYDGPTALREAASWHPEVVFLDLAMPGMDGYEVARELVRQGGPRRPVLIALTGYAQEEARHKAMEAGFDYFIVKPVAPDKLKGLLDTAADHPKESATGPA